MGICTQIVEEFHVFEVLSEEDFFATMVNVFNYLMFFMQCTDKIRGGRREVDI